MCVVRWIGPRCACTRVSGFWDSLVYKCICNLCFKPVTDNWPQIIICSTSQQNPNSESAPKAPLRHGLMWKRGPHKAWQKSSVILRKAASRQLCPATKRAPAINSYALGRWSWSKISCGMSMCACGSFYAFSAMMIQWHAESSDCRMRKTDITQPIKRRRLPYPPPEPVKLCQQVEHSLLIRKGIL